MMQLAQQAQLSKDPQTFVQELSKKDPKTAQKVQEILSQGQDPKTVVLSELQKRGIDPTQLFGLKK